MNCGETRYELSAYLDRELPDADRQAVEAHVAGCAACRQRLAELERIVTGMAELPGQETAPGFLTEVRRRIEAGIEPASSWGWWVQASAATVAALLVVGGAVWMLQEPPRAPERKSLAWQYAPPTDEKVMVVAADRSRAENLAPTLPEAPTPERMKALDPSAKPFAHAPVTSAPAAPVVDKLKVPAETKAAETIVVEDADAPKVLKGASLIASSLQGRAAPLRALPDGGQSFRVELPAANVAAFKARLTWQQEAGKDEDGVAGEKTMRRTAAKGGEAGGRGYVGVAPGAMADGKFAKRGTAATGAAATGWRADDTEKDTVATNLTLRKAEEPVKEAEDAVTVLEIQVKAPAR
jgi:hypothetical protein